VPCQPAKAVKDTHNHRAITILFRYYRLTRSQCSVFRLFKLAIHKGKGIDCNINLKLRFSGKISKNHTFSTAKSPLTEANELIP
jgi:hypothetical protein